MAYALPLFLRSASGTAVPVSGTTTVELVSDGERKRVAAKGLSMLTKEQEGDYHPAID